jgi:hypothetical protein
LSVRGSQFTKHGGKRGTYSRDGQANADNAHLAVGVLDAVKSGASDRLDFRLPVHLLGVVGHDGLESSFGCPLVQLAVLGAAPALDIEDMLDIMRLTKQ